jgi:hypothetical protein
MLFILFLALAWAARRVTGMVILILKPNVQIVDD